MTAPKPPGSSPQWGSYGGWPPGWYPPPGGSLSVDGRPPPAGGRKAGWRMLAVFLTAEATFLLASLFVLLPFALADPRVAAAGPLPPMALLAALAVPTTLAALVAVGATRLFGSGPRRGRLLRELSVRWIWRDVGYGLVLGAAGLVLTIPASALWAAWVGTDRAHSAVGEAFDGQLLDPVTAVTLFLVVWLIAPMCEEVLFRGALWRALEHWRLNRWLIFVVTTLAFSVAHLELLRTPLLIMISLPIGLARVMTGNLLSSIVAHQANNLLPAIGLLLMTLGLMPG